MPYIKDYEREAYKNTVEALANQLSIMPCGHVNYVISKIVTEIFRKDQSYTCANMLIGVLDCVKLELYRKHIGLYEDKKATENGEI